MTEYSEQSKKRVNAPLRAIIFIVTVVVAGALTWAALDHFLGEKGAAPAPLTAEAPLFVSDEFGFSAKFPAEPVRQDEAANAGEQEITITTFSTGELANSYGVTTMAMACKPTGRDIDARLKGSADGAVSGAAESIGAAPTVSSQQPVTIAGHPGLQTDFTVANGTENLHVMSAVLLDGPRFYMLTANNPTVESWANFLASFTTLKAPAAAPECAPLAGL